MPTEREMFQNMTVSSLGMELREEKGQTKIMEVWIEAGTVLHFTIMWGESIFQLMVLEQHFCTTVWTKFKPASLRTSLLLDDTHKANRTKITSNYLKKIKTNHLQTWINHHVLLLNKTRATVKLCGNKIFQRLVTKRQKQQLAIAINLDFTGITSLRITTTKKKKPKSLCKTIKLLSKNK